jgi:hypothetical protein
MHDGGVTALGFSDEVTSLIDPVVVPRGFASGQGDGGQVIFCAAFDDVADRFPHLPQADQQQRGVGACVDLVLTADDRMNLASVQLEGTSLEETLRQVGLDVRAIALREAMRGDRTHALAAVASAMRDLLAASE